MQSMNEKNEKSTQVSSNKEIGTNFLCNFKSNESSTHLLQYPIFLMQLRVLTNNNLVSGASRLLAFSSFTNNQICIEDYQTQSEYSAFQGPQVSADMKCYYFSQLSWLIILSRFFTYSRDLKLELSCFYSFLF